MVISVIRGWFTRFVTDTRASMSVEFALLAPLIATMLVGTLQAGTILEGHRRSKLAAEVLGDSIARIPTLTSADITSLQIAVKGTLSSGANGGGVSANAAFVPFDANGAILPTARVVPIFGSAPADQLRSIATRAAIPSQVVVVAQVVEQVDSLVGNVLPTITIRQTFVSPVRTATMPTLTGVVTTVLP